MTPTSNEASVEDALAFIAEHPHVYLLARRADAYPTGYAMMSRVRDGGVEFSTYRTSAKVRNLLRDGVAGILALSRVDDRVLSAVGPVTVEDASTWFEAGAPGTGATGSGATASGAGRTGAAPLVPREITDKVGARHDDGRRCVLRVVIDHARFSRRFV